MAEIIRDVQHTESNSLPSNDRTSAIRNFQNKPFSADEVIVWLADTHENRRARQVGDWERVQPHNIRRFY
jgi:hypothetical protein